ncbi:Hypothetical predicted protein [Pelobates cultripes]|uniref:Uncharacterized protein n=1 Tax=Pelobates cultripes TaxID=61616 RepID=A0AAD1R747_PELCU|nr:Hypothetical predicted protein [Pelobates cultripes]
MLNPLPSTSLTLNKWNKWAKTLLPRRNPLWYAPLQSLQYYTTDLKLQAWVRAGIQQYAQLFGEEGIQPFLRLQERFALPNMELFTYISVKHKAQETPGPPPDPSLMGNFERLCIGGKLSRKALAACYRAIQDTQRPLRFSYMVNWEKEIGQEFTTYHHISMGGTTPLLDTNQRGDNQADRGSDFPTHGTIYTTYLPEDLQYTEQSGNKVLIATKQCIASLWKTKEPPPLTMVLEKLDKTRVYEKMSHSLTNTSQKCEQTWENWDTLWAEYADKEDREADGMQNPQTGS